MCITAFFKKNKKHSYLFNVNGINHILSLKIKHSLG